MSDSGDTKEAADLSGMNEADDFRASYLALHESGELARRVEALESLLRACTS